MSAVKTIGARLAEIEAKLAFADDMLDALNKTIYRQQQHIERLQQELRALQEIVDSAGDSESSTPRDEMPPHY